ncbi:hypothetical protein RJ640_004177, partial [Escallonia rubra]
MFRRNPTNQSHQRNNSDWNVRENSDACYECGRTGHIKKYCPQLRNKTANSNSNSRDLKEKKFKSRKALLTWDDSDKSDKEESEDEDVAQLCFMANDDDLKVTPEKHLNELQSAFLELSKNYEKLKIKNTDLKNKAFSLINTVEELEDEKEELQEKIKFYVSKNVSLKNNVNAFKKENFLDHSEIKIPVENESLKSQLEDMTTQKINLEKEIEDLNFTLSKFTQGRENLDILLGKQRCVFEKSGIGYDPSKKQKDYKNFFNKSLVSCSPFTLCTFEGEKCLISHASDGSTLIGKRDGNIYTLSFDASDHSREVCLSVQHNDIWLWHRRLGHVHMDLIKKLLSKDLVRGLPNLRFIKDKICDACQYGKQSKTSFQAKNVVSTSRPLQLLHLDLFGPTRNASLGGKFYAFVIVDDFSRYTWVLFLTRKDEAFENFLSLVKQLQNEKELKLVKIRSDHGDQVIGNVERGVTTRSTSKEGIFINQSKYTRELLKRFGLENAKPRGTPISPSVNLIKDENGKDVDSKLFRDSDYAGCLVDRKSTSGTCQFLGDALVSWHSKKQTSVALSTAEAEYVAAGSCCAQVLWMRQTLQDFGVSLALIPIMCDSSSAIDINQLTYYTLFVNREVIPGRPSDVNLMTQLGVTALFERMGCLSILSPPSTYYPALVRMFYSNLHFDAQPPTFLTSYVNGVHIRLDATTLAHIFGFENQSSTLVFTANTWCTSSSFTPLQQTQTLLGDPSITHPRKPHLSDMSPLSRVLHLILCYNLSARSGSYATFSYLDIILLTHFLRGSPLNIAGIIMLVMHARKNKSTANLPFGLLLTRVFEHFNVPLPTSNSERILLPSHH